MYCHFHPPTLYRRSFDTSPYNLTIRPEFATQNFVGLSITLNHVALFPPFSLYSCRDLPYATGTDQGCRIIEAFKDMEALVLLVLNVPMHEQVQAPLVLSLVNVTFTTCGGFRSIGSTNQLRWEAIVRCHMFTIRRLGTE